MIVRVYTFSEDIVWYLRHIQKYRMEEITKFYRCDYRVRLSIDVSLRMAALKKRICSDGLMNGIGYVINTDEIVEMDDGCRPVFFYVRKDGIKKIHIEQSCDRQGNRTLIYDEASIQYQLADSFVRDKYATE